MSFLSTSCKIFHFSFLAMSKNRFLAMSFLSNVWHRLVQKVLVQVTYSSIRLKSIIGHDGTVSIGYWINVFPILNYPPGIPFTFTFTSFLPESKESKFNGKTLPYSGFEPKIFGYQAMKSTLQPIAMKRPLQIKNLQPVLRFKHRACV
jgi:hypothetical protein